MCKGSHSAWAMMAAALTCLGVNTAGAQTRRIDSPVSTVDAYGNARHRYVELSSFSPYTPSPAFRPPTNSPASQLLRSRKNLSRAGLGEAGGVGRFESTALRGARTPWVDGSSMLPPSYQQYGGFGQRYSTGGTIGGALHRKQSLIQASSLTAPVKRAMIRYSSYGDPLQALANVPFIEAPIDSEPQPEVALDTLLAEGVDVAYENALVEAWDQFRDVKYRLAARSFEAAATLRPEDLEPSIGYIFSLVSIGAMKSAGAMLATLANEGRDLFSPADAVEMPSRYPRPADVGDVAIQTRLHMSQNTADADAAALNVFVQWHLGRRSEAVAAATALARNFPTSAYAFWADRLKSSS